MLIRRMMPWYKASTAPFAPSFSAVLLFGDERFHVHSFFPLDGLPFPFPFPSLYAPLSLQLGLYFARRP